MTTFDKELFITNLQSLETKRFGSSLSSEEITKLLKESVEPSEVLEETVKRKITFKRKPTKLTSEYFIKTAKKYNHIIYKYKPSIFWTGPAIVNTSKNLEKVRKQFIKIPIKVDHDTDRNLLIVYPDIKAPENFEYDKNYEPDDTPT